MDLFAFWRDMENRFRTLPGPVRHLHAIGSDEKPEEYVAEQGQMLRDLALGTPTTRPINPDYPIDAIVSWTRRVAHVGRMLVDGEYIRRWVITGSGNDDYQLLDVLKSRFRTEAALAARAAVAVQSSASVDEAVDRWLDFLEQGSNPYVRGDNSAWIEALPEASAVMCAELAARAYAQQSAAVLTPAADSPRLSGDVQSDALASQSQTRRAAWLTAQLKARGISLKKLAELSGVDRSAIYAWRNYETQTMTAANRAAIAQVLDVAVTEIPD